jgi:hypothetical protein
MPPYPASPYPAPYPASSKASSKITLTDLPRVPLAF